MHIPQALSLDQNNVTLCLTKTKTITKQKNTSSPLPKKKRNPEPQRSHSAFSGVLLVFLWVLTEWFFLVGKKVECVWGEMLCLCVLAGWVDGVVVVVVGGVLCGDCGGCVWLCVVVWLCGVRDFKRPIVCLRSIRVCQQHAGVLKATHGHVLNAHTHRVVLRLSSRRCRHVVVVVVVLSGHMSCLLSEET